MAGAGDYTHYTQHYNDKTADLSVGSGETKTIVPKSASHQLFVQRITVSITTHANAKFVSAGDGTLMIGKLTDKTAAAGVPDVVVFDFGPKGRAMTVGATLSIISEASGPVADVHVECYEKLGAVISYLAGASLQ